MVLLRIQTILYGRTVVLAWHCQMPNEVESDESCLSLSSLLKSEDVVDCAAGTN